MHKISYTADGIATEFVFAFPFFQSADVRVAVNGVMIGGSQFNLFDWENRDGGKIIFAEPPAAGTVIDIFRRIALDRFIDYQPSAKIEPEKLNEDFNFLLEAFRDLNEIEIDLAEWKNIHSATINLIEQTKSLIQDQIGGGAFMSLLQNLLPVLATALPQLRGDCGEITDDYGSIE